LEPGKTDDGFKAFWAASRNDDHGSVSDFLRGSAYEKIELEKNASWVQKNACLFAGSCILSE